MITRKWKIQDTWFSKTIHAAPELQNNTTQPLQELQKYKMTKAKS